MTKIVYNEQTVIDAKKNIDMCNDSILEALKKIQTEFSNIEKIVNTPKMNKSLPAILEYFNKKVTYVSSNKETFNNTLNTINESYHDYIVSISNMVGGNND